MGDEPSVVNLFSLIIGYSPEVFDEPIMVTGNTILFKLFVPEAHFTICHTSFRINVELVLVTEWTNTDPFFRGLLEKFYSVIGKWTDTSGLLSSGGGPVTLRHLDCPKRAPFKRILGKFFPL